MFFATTRENKNLYCTLKNVWAASFWATTTWENNHQMVKVIRRSPVCKRFSFKSVARSVEDHFWLRDKRFVTQVWKSILFELNWPSLPESRNPYKPRERLTSSGMSRLTWVTQNFAESYSKDPNQAAVLLDSLAHRNISDFRYALEVMKCDPNLLDVSSGVSVFQTVLQTPNSAEFIQICINSGASFYKV